VFVVFSRSIKRFFSTALSVEKGDLTSRDGRDAMGVDNTLFEPT